MDIIEVAENIINHETINGGLPKDESINMSYSIVNGLGPCTENGTINVQAKNTIQRKVESNPRLPYILNGELYRVQTQHGEYVTATCCHCSSSRLYRGNVRSTGNFLMHIKRRHPNLLGKLYDVKMNSLLERRDSFVRSGKFYASRQNRKILSNKNNNVLPKYSYQFGKTFTKGQMQQHLCKQDEKDFFNFMNAANLAVRNFRNVLFDAVNSSAVREQFNDTTIEHLMPNPYVSRHGVDLNRNKVPMDIAQIENVPDSSSEQVLDLSIRPISYNNYSEGYVHTKQIGHRTMPTLNQTSFDITERIKYLK